jgi:ferric-dicitrate binding protein FerR (iron transport regulator)
MYQQQKKIEDYLIDDDFIDWANKNPIDETAFEQFDGIENASIVKEAFEVYQLLQLKEKNIDSNLIQVEKMKLLNSIEQNSKQKTIIQTASNFIKIAWAAAALFILMAGGLIWLNFNNPISISTAYGKKIEKSLPDGSTVKLNSHSNISYSKKFGKNNIREIWVKGEAFFHVQSTQEKTKFIVHLDKFDIEVTGTKFNVENINGTSKVLLTEGSIKLLTKNGVQKILKPGDYIVVGKDETLNQTSILQKAKEENILAWVENKIVFDVTTLKDAAEIIKNIYGYEVIIKDESLSTKKISGILPNDNLEVLLKALEATNDFKIKTENKTITIEPTN